MRARQAKVSVDTAKEVANDKTIKNKAEKDRMVKEKTANNTKKFIEERKTAAIQQDKEKTKLEKVHKDQMEKMITEKKQVITTYYFFHFKTQYCFLSMLMASALRWDAVHNKDSVFLQRVTR